MTVQEQDESTLETRQRAYDTGLRYGHLDAKAGLTGPSTPAERVVAASCADVYQRGWRAGYGAYMAPLRTPGVRVSIPSLVPGERLPAWVTGQTKAVEGIVHVECYPSRGTTPLWIPVSRVQAK